MPKPPPDKAPTGMVPFRRIPMEEAGNTAILEQYMKHNNSLMLEFKELKWAYIGYSEAIIWKRPSENNLKLLKEYLGITMVVTCMYDPSEGVPELRKWC